MNWINRHRWTLAWIAVLGLAWAIRLHNAFAYNPYWGYDGGAHLSYIETIAHSGRLPAPSENYLAWHEPLFYIISAGIFNWARILGVQDPWIAVQIFQAVLGTIFVGLAGYLAWEAYRKPGLAMATAATIAVLPPAIFVSSYTTNELLAHVLILGALILTLRTARTGRFNPRDGVWIGLLAGLAMLTKLTSLVLLASLAAFFIVTAILKRSAAPLRTLGAMLIIAIPLALPWQAYREQSLGGALRLNNFEQKAVDAASAHPRRFYVSFDRSILETPYWDSGSRGMLSILYAGTFGDYDNVFGNVDRDNILPGDKKILTTSGRYVTTDRFAAAWTTLRFSLVFLPILLVGLLATAFRLVRSRFAANADLLLALFVAITGAALIYYTVRYPFLERGTLKPIFVLSVLPIIFLCGWKSLLGIKHRWAPGVLVAGILAVFTAFAWPVIWITSG